MRFLLDELFTLDSTKIRMADRSLDKIMQDLQAHIKNSKIDLNNLSSIAKNGDEKLVEKFLSEAVFTQPSLGHRKLADNKKAVLQSQLYVACFWGVKNIARDIIELADSQEIDIDISAKNPQTLWTPLHAATFQEHGPLIMYLLEKGANPRSQDSNNRSSIDFASASDKTWGHFAALGCPRTPKATLMDMGILRKNTGVSSSPKNSPRMAGRGIEMAEYSHPDSSYEYASDPHLGAAVSGDVLANDEDKVANQNQPQFAIYK